LSIQGRSGQGKTTLLRLIAGLEAADDGNMTIDGKSAMANGKLLLQPWERGVQIVFQDLGLWPTRNVLQNVLDPLRAKGVSKTEALSKAQSLLMELGLSERLKSRPGTLSGGEGRRLALARALAVQPQLLLLDEPFTSLDPETRQRSYELLDRALEHQQTAVILVTHDPEEAARLGGTCRQLSEEGQLI
jgi:ABC-type nitrate/sulfonate/bicarbonate transport system ATPase subunit